MPRRKPFLVAVTCADEFAAAWIGDGAIAMTARENAQRTRRIRWGQTARAIMLRR
ncbi:MAG: hypothetical protein ACRD4H_06530 [Candidatus Acidiferrales bacterium]